MSLWDDSHWIDGYVARVNHVFAGGDSCQIDFSWESLEPHQGTGRVGWRPLVSEDRTVVTSMLQICSLAKENGWPLLLRVTNDGQITAVQTTKVPAPRRFDIDIRDMATIRDRVSGVAALDESDEG